MNYYEWFRTIAAVLNDDEPERPFQRYALRDMVAAYNRATGIIASRRPDLFTSRKKVKLVAGKYQDVSGCCANVLEVLEQLDANGNIVKSLAKARKTTTKTTTTWKKPSCLPPVDVDGEEYPYVMNNAHLDQTMNGAFSVEPEVPCDVDAWVMVKCVQPPCPLHEAATNGDIDNNHIHNTASWHYVLASMLAGDRHAVGATQEMNYHYSMFFALLELEFKAESDLESPEKA